MVVDSICGSQVPVSNYLQDRSRKVVRTTDHHLLLSDALVRRRADDLAAADPDDHPHSDRADPDGHAHPEPRAVDRARLILATARKVNNR